MALALPADVSAILPGYDDAAATVAISFASSAVESYCQRVFEQVIADVEIVTTAGYEGLLSQWPVTEVSKVEVKSVNPDGSISWTETVAYDYTPQGVIYCTLRSFISGTSINWPLGLPGGLRVTYTHGYITPPTALRDVVVRIACMYLSNPVAGRTVHKVGDNQDAWSAASATAVSPYDESILAAYSKRGIR